MTRRFSLRSPDTCFLLALLALSLFGVAMIYSAGELNVRSQVVEGAWLRQLGWLALSLTAFALVAQLPQSWIERAALPVYILALLLLAATLAVGTGTGTAAGVRSFLQIGGVRFQAAEVAKVATILLLARLMAGRFGASGKQLQPWRFTGLFAPCAVVALPLLLVVLQPDLGTALAFVGILAAVLFWAGTPWMYLVLLASPGGALMLSFSTWWFSAYIVILVVALHLLRTRLLAVEYAAVLVLNLAVGTVARVFWESLAPYQQNRVLVFLNPSLDPRGVGYHVVQSKVAIGSGGLTGKGFTLGTQKRLNFLPEQHTDFIFAVVGEEFGFLGTILVLAVFGWVLFWLVRMAETTRSRFASFVLFGIFGAWITHITVNTGMIAGLAPVTGIPLPFLSYGGSFLLMCWVAVALAFASRE